jgi:hypothetical protein
VVTQKKRNKANLLVFFFCLLRFNHYFSLSCINKQYENKIQGINSQLVLLATSQVIEIKVGQSCLID